jgi:hypothetical protein
MKIHPVGQELRIEKETDRSTDRHTDMTKLIVTIRNFAKTPKMETKYVVGLIQAWDGKICIILL